MQPLTRHNTAPTIVARAMLRIPVRFHRSTASSDELTGGLPGINTARLPDSTEQHQPCRENFGSYNTGEDVLAPKLRAVGQFGGRVGKYC